MNDDSFADFAKKAEAESKARQTRGSGSGSFQFEEVHWTGLVSGRPKIIRAIGGAPDSGESPATAVTRRISWITGDNGKKFRAILPEKDDNPDHLLWKVIAAVNETTYVNKVKVFIHQQKNPELFRMINKNGLEETDKKAMFDTGWMGKTKFIMNCIDREQIAWHKENKHTLLLSKSVNVDGDKVYAEEGVPAFGFVNLLATGIFKFYKDWRNYDLGITRTGLKETPYRIVNASKYFEELPDDLQKLVASGALTAEELSWETYDLQKLFKITPMTKIYNNLKLSIQKIDARLGTKFDKLFKEAVEKEADEKELNKRDDEEIVPDSGQDQSWNPENDVKVVFAPKARERKTETAKSTGGDTSSLPGWGNLNEDERSVITGFTTDSKGAITVQYSMNTDELLKCGTCGVPSPETFGHCPACGMDFE